MVRIDDALRELCKALDLDPDQWIRSIEERKAQAEEPDINAVLGQLEVQKAEGEIAKTEAETAKVEAEADAVGARVKIERAKTVAELQQGGSGKGGQV